MTIHHIADYMTQSARHDAFMRRHPIVDIPCDVEPRFVGVDLAKGPDRTAMWLNRNAWALDIIKGFHPPRPPKVRMRDG